MERWVSYARTSDEILADIARKADRLETIERLNREITRGKEALASGKFIYTAYSEYIVGVLQEAVLADE